MVGKKRQKKNVWKFLINMKYRPLQKRGEFIYFVKKNRDYCYKKKRNSNTCFKLHLFLSSEEINFEKWSLIPYEYTNEIFLRDNWISYTEEEFYQKFKNITNNKKPDIIVK